MIKLFYFFILTHFSIISMNVDLQDLDLNTDCFEEDKKNVEKKKHKKHVTFKIDIENQKDQNSSNSAVCLDHSDVFDEIEISESLNNVDFLKEIDFLVSVDDPSNINNEIYFEVKEAPVSLQDNDNKVKSEVSKK